MSECSEEAVIVGILRLADEIKVKHPKSVVVIESILPRSSFSDGHVRTMQNFTSTRTFFHQHKEYVNKEEYPLWPSIQLINSEVAKFCAKHEHLVRVLMVNLLGNRSQIPAVSFWGEQGQPFSNSSPASSLLAALF